MAITEAQLKVSQTLQSIAHGLDEVLTEQTGVKMGFALFIFNEEHDGHLQYVSNCARPEVLEALKDFLARQDTPLIEVPLHEKLNPQ